MQFFFACDVTQQPKDSMLLTYYPAHQIIGQIIFLILSPRDRCCRNFFIDAIKREKTCIVDRLDCGVHITLTGWQRSFGTLFIGGCPNA